MTSLLRSSAFQRAVRPWRRHLNAHSARVVDQRTAGLRAQISDMKDSASGIVRQVADLDAEVAQIRSQLDGLRRQASASSKAATLIRAEVATLNGSLERISALERGIGTWQASLDLLLGPTGRYVTRQADVTEFATLRSEFASFANPDSIDVALAQAYRLLVELELRSLGRFAGRVPNIVSRLAAVVLLPPPTGEVLEIGTLFGVGAVGAARQLTRIGLQPRVTVLDPMLGHQAQPGLDAERDVSASPVIPTVLAANMALGGIDPSCYRLLQGLSSDPDVKGASADRLYGLVIIDGDHSEEVAFDDLCFAEAVVEPGGLVILDDYRDPTWPGVEAALDRYLARSDARLRVVGAAATSAFLRAPTA